MNRAAARIGATLPDGVPGVAEVVGAQLERELAGEPHGSVEIMVAPQHLAGRFMDWIGVAPASPTRTFLADHPDAVLVIAVAATV